jgi:hypothetical protein
MSLNVGKCRILDPVEKVAWELLGLAGRCGLDDSRELATAAPSALWRPPGLLAKDA